MRKLKLFSLLLFLLIGIGQVWATDPSWAWTASSGDFGSSSPGSTSGNVTLNSKSWSYERSQAGYLGWGNSSIQFGSGSKKEAVTLTCSAFSEVTITSISVKGSSKDGRHYVTIKVGEDVVKSATQLPTPTSTPSAITTGTISKSGTITIIFDKNSTALSGALYLQEISITYTEGGSNKPTLFLNPSLSPSNFLIYNSAQELR